jgi:hypothetical protein
MQKGFDRGLNFYEKQSAQKKLKNPPTQKLKESKTQKLKDSIT